MGSFQKDGRAVFVLLILLLGIEFTEEAPVEHLPENASDSGDVQRFLKALNTTVSNIESASYDTTDYDDFEELLKSWNVTIPAEALLGPFLSRQRRHESTTGEEFYWGQHDGKVNKTCTKNQDPLTVEELYRRHIYDKTAIHYFAEDLVNYAEYHLSRNCASKMCIFDPTTYSYLCATSTRSISSLSKALTVFAILIFFESC